MGLFFYSEFFDPQTTWKTINQGVSKLPEKCADAVLKKKGDVCLCAKVKSMRQSDEAVTIGYSQPESADLSYEEFDAVIMAIPCTYIRLIPDRPHFGARLEQALRAASSSMVLKFGIRFHSRFWERSDLMLPPSFGGQSATDMPVRWVIYPPFGIGDGGKGVLHIYNWAGDSTQWQLMSKEEKLETALNNLQQLYPEVDIAKEYAGCERGDDGYLDEAFEFDWRCFPFFKAGQFLNYFPDLVRPQGNVYFAGGHLSSSVAWAAGALESARRAVRQLASKYGIEDIDYIH